MADIRINALATTATTPASDDYLALDGTAQGTRKILATNIANNVTDVILGASGPSVKSTLSARAPRQGLVFDGSSAAVTTTLGSAIGTGNFTIAAWVNPSAATAKQIIAGQNDGNGSMGLETGGVVAWYDSTAGGKNFNVTAPVGKASLVVITRSSNTLTAYLNGVAGDQHTTAHNLSSTSWRVGSYSGGEQFGGLIASPLIYNRALSASEVVSLYEAGAPKGTDYNTASNTSVITGSFYNNSLNSFSGASSTGFTATCTSSVGYAAVSLATPYPTVGQKVRVSITLSATTATLYAWLHIGGYGPGDATGSPVLLTAGTTNVIEYTINSTYAPNGTNTLCIGTLDGSSNGATFTVSNAAVYRLGLLLAPDAAQAGGGLVWYDTSGNAANITLPASGVSWNVPSSRVLGGNWTTSGNLTVSGTGITVSNANPDINGLNITASTGTNAAAMKFVNSGGNYYFGADSSTGGRIQNATGIAYAMVLATESARPLMFFTNNTFGGMFSTTQNFLLGTTIDGGQKLQVSGTAAISGALSIGNTVQTAASVASTHKVTISIGGSTYYLLATNV